MDHACTYFLTHMAHNILLPHVQLPKPLRYLFMSKAQRRMEE